MTLTTAIILNGVMSFVVAAGLAAVVRVALRLRTRRTRMLHWSEPLDASLFAYEHAREHDEPALARAA